MTIGKEPFAGGPPGLRARDATPIRPSAIVPEVDAALESVILQCLERDPKRRPDSAYAVAAALPDGDPLASALAAGQTPSPSMVAAAGRQGQWGSRAAACCLAIALLALFVVVLLADRTFFLPQAGLEKPPAVLADKAERIIAMLGASPPVKSIGKDLPLIAATYGTPWRERTKLACGRISPAIVPRRFPSGIAPAAIRLLCLPCWANRSPARVFPTEPGMVMVRLDGRGRLLEYSVSPDQTRGFNATSQSVDWSAVFQLAGLSIAQFKSIPPVRVPPMYADALAAWEGAYPANQAIPIRVKGASLGSRAVFFEVVPPWDQDWSDAEEGPSRVVRLMPIVRSALYLLAILGGGFLAWHNIRLGRGDQQGAYKLLVFVLFLGLLDWLLGERHVAVFTEELALFYLWLAREF